MVDGMATSTQQKAGHQKKMAFQAKITMSKEEGTPIGCKTAHHFHKAAHRQ